MQSILLSAKFCNYNMPLPEKKNGIYMQDL